MQFSILRTCQHPSAKRRGTEVGERLEDLGGLAAVQSDHDSASVQISLASPVREPGNEVSLEEVPNLLWTSFLLVLSVGSVIPMHLLHIE